MPAVAFGFGTGSASGDPTIIATLGAMMRAMLATNVANMKHIVVGVDSVKAEVSSLGGRTRGKEPRS